MRGDERVISEENLGLLRSLRLDRELREAARRTGAMTYEGNRCERGHATRSVRDGGCDCVRIREQLRADVGDYSRAQFEATVCS